MDGHGVLPMTASQGLKHTLFFRVCIWSVTVFIAAKSYQHNVNMVDLSHTCLYRLHIDVFQLPEHQS